MLANVVCSVILAVPSMPILAPVVLDTPREGITFQGASIGIDGTANITLQTTFANIADNAIFAGTFDVFSHSYLSALTASAFDTVDTREIGVKLKVNSWSSGNVRLDLSVSAKG